MSAEAAGNKRNQAEGQLPITPVCSNFAQDKEKKNTSPPLQSAEPAGGGRFLSLHYYFLETARVSSTQAKGPCPANGALHFRACSVQSGELACLLSALVLQSQQELEAEKKKMTEPTFLKGKDSKVHLLEGPAKGSCSEMRQKKRGLQQHYQLSLKNKTKKSQAH